MKTRSTQWSLFTLLILLFAQEFMRSVMASSSSAFSKALLDSGIQSDKFHLKKHILNKDDLIELLKFSVSRNQTDVPMEILTDYKAMRFTTVDLLKPFLAALDNQFFPNINLLLQEAPNLVHLVIDQGPIHQKKPALPQIEKLKDGKIVTQAFQYGADANNEGKTFPLRHAVMAKLWKYAEILVEQGAITNLKITPDTSIIQFLTQSNQTDLAIKMISSTQALEYTQMQSSLMEAIKRKQNDFVVACFKRAASLEEAHLVRLTYSNHYTEILLPVHAAVIANNSALLNAMKQLNFDLTRLTLEGNISPMAIAIRESYHAIFDQLLALGVDPLQDRSELPLIFRTVIHNNTEELKKLIALGYPINSLYTGRTVLNYCHQYQLDSGLIELLIKHGARSSSYYEFFLFFTYNSPKLLMTMIFSWLGLSYLVLNEKLGLLKLLETSYHKYMHPFEQRDLQIMQMLRSLLQEFYPNQIQVTAHRGVFSITLSLQRISYKLSESDKVFQIQSSDAHAVFVECLLRLNSTELSVAINNGILSVTLKNPQTMKVPKIQKDEILQRIKSQLQHLVHKMPEYKQMLIECEKRALTVQSHQLRTALLKSLQECRSQVTHAHSRLERLENQSIVSQKQLNTILNEHRDLDWRNSKRLQKPMETVQREIDKFNHQHCLNVKKNLSSQSETLEMMQAEIQNNNLPLLRNKLNQINDYVIHCTIDPVDYMTSLTQTIAQLVDGIERFIQDMKKTDKSNPVAQSKEQKKAQRELEAQRKQEEELRLQQENEERKRQYRIQSEEQRKQLALQRQAEAERQERRRNAELKRQEELRAEQLRRLQSSSSSSSNAQLHPALKAKVTTIGDLLQRTEREKYLNEHMRIQYHFALLAQCLRLFEMTDQYLSLRISSDIRNTLMHRHRYFDLAALRELAGLIAHRPDGSDSVSAPKFEDIINELQENSTPQLIEKLRLCLISLSLSKFHDTYVKVELQRPTAEQQIQTIQYLLNDLAQLNTKLELGLTAFPDKILAIQGILMCIGECFQQLTHLNEHGTFFENIDMEFNNFIRYAKSTRDQMAHTVDEPLENEGIYIKFLHQSESFAEQTEQLLLHYQADTARMGFMAY